MNRFLEFTFKHNDDIADEIKKIILPNNEIANEIEKMPVLDNLESS